ncbi:MAG: hypothetical protein GY950_09955, partial [bacterium]|nr:hypothetical protein [bacterium]
ETTEEKPPDEPPQPVDEEKKQRYGQLNQKIKDRLIAIYTGILNSGTPFENYRSAGLKILLDEFQSDNINKFYKFSFYDLNETAFLSLPGEYEDSLKFNIFLSLFLVKLQEEEMLKKLEELPGSEFEKAVNLDVYRLIANEVREDYQTMPVLCYFTVLLKRLHLYPASDSTGFFKEQLTPLEDSTEAKYLVRIRELLRFSTTVTPYRLQWKEYDSIGPNDKKEYGNLALKTITFLGQSYLIFPDPEASHNNRWIKDLRDADTGDIELVEFKMISRDRTRPLHLKKILYTPVSSEFVILLKEYEPHPDTFLNTMVKKKMANFHKSLMMVDFTIGELEKETLKKQLDQFGNYLKELDL